MLTRRARLAAALFYAVVHATGAFGATAIILDRTHESQVLHETRNYRIFLPPDYPGMTLELLGLRP